MRLCVAVPPLLPGPAGYLAPPLGAVRAVRAARLAGAEAALVDLALLCALGRLPPGAGFYAAGGRALEAGAWDVVAFSIQAAGFPPAAALAARLKQARPDLTVVAAGPHALTCAGPLLRLGPSFDYAVRGDAERVMGPLVAMLRKTIPASEVPGLSFRTSDGRVRHNPAPPRSPVTPLTAQDLGGRRQAELYRRACGELVLPVECGRGCSLDCIYCWNCGSPPAQARPPAEVAGETELLAGGLLPDRLFLFGMFCGGRSAALRLAGELERRPLPPWHTQCRLEALDGEVLEALSRAGCGNILTLAAEAGPAPGTRRPGAPAAPTPSPAAWARVRELAGIGEKLGVWLHVYSPFDAAAAAGPPGMAAAMKEMLDAALRGHPVPMWYRRGLPGPGALKRARVSSPRDRLTFEAPLLDFGRRGRLPADAAAIRRWPGLCSVYFTPPLAIPRPLALDAWALFPAAVARFPLSWACLERALGTDGPGVLRAWRARRARSRRRATAGRPISGTRATASQSTSRRRAATDRLAPGRRKSARQPTRAGARDAGFKRFARSLGAEAVTARSLCTEAVTARSLGAGAARARGRRRHRPRDEVRWLAQLVRYEDCLGRVDRRSGAARARPGEGAQEPAGEGTGQQSGAEVLRVNPTLILSPFNPGLPAAIRALRSGAPLPAWEEQAPVPYAFWSWNGRLQAVRLAAGMAEALQDMAGDPARVTWPAGAPSGIPPEALQELERRGLLVRQGRPAPGLGRRRH